MLYINPNKLLTTPLKIFNKDKFNKIFRNMCSEIVFEWSIPAISQSLIHWTSHNICIVQPIIWTVWIAFYMDCCSLINCYCKLKHCLFFVFNLHEKSRSITQKFTYLILQYWRLLNIESFTRESKHRIEKTHFLHYLQQNLLGWWFSRERNLYSLKTRRKLILI